MHTMASALSLQGSPIMAQQQSFLSETSALAQGDRTRLRAYLDGLEKPLASLGAATAADWRREAEAHLWSLIVANEELGASREEAVTAALKQFGDERRVGQRVAREVRRQRRLGL